MKKDSKDLDTRIKLELGMELKKVNNWVGGVDYSVVLMHVGASGESRKSKKLIPKGVISDFMVHPVGGHIEIPIEKAVYEQLLKQVEKEKSSGRNTPYGEISIKLYTRSV